MTTEFEKKVDGLIASINKNYGEGSIIRMSGNSLTGKVEMIPSALPLLDYTISKEAPGIPKGRIIEIFGKESCGKSTLVMQHIGTRPGPCLYIDTEHVFDRDYAKKLGVDTENLLISQPEDLEQALGIMYDMSEVCDTIVMDSAVGVDVKAAKEKAIGDSIMGTPAKRLFELMRKIPDRIRHSGCTCLFTNQLRDVIGGYGGTYTPGGHALKFYATIRINLIPLKAKPIVTGQPEIGNYVMMKVVKNKIAPPFRVCEVPLVFGEGFSEVLQVLDLADERSVITKSGSWYSYGDVKLGQGKMNTKMFLEDNPEVYQEIKTKCLAI